MIHLHLPLALVGVLVAAGGYGILARRNAVLMLIGVELVLAAAGLLMVTMGAARPDPYVSGQVLTIFLITIAAAEIAVALAMVVAVYRARGDIDLTRRGEEDAALEEGGEHA